MFIILAMILSIAVFTGRTVHAVSDVSISGVGEIVDGLNMNGNMRVNEEISFNIDDFCGLNDNLMEKYLEDSEITFKLRQRYDSGTFVTRNLTKSGNKYSFTATESDMDSSFCIVAYEPDSNTEYYSEFFEVVVGDVFDKITGDLSSGPVKGSYFDPPSGPFINAFYEILSEGKITSGNTADGKSTWYDLDKDGTADINVTKEYLIFSIADTSSIDTAITLYPDDDAVKNYYKHCGSIARAITLIFSHSTSIKTATVSNIKDVTYTGKAITPKPLVQYNHTTLTEGTDYTLKYENNKNVGAATVIVVGINDYVGKKSIIFNIKKAANPLSVKGKMAIVKYSKLRIKNQTLKVSKVIYTKKKGQGTITYTKSSGNKKISINKKTGKVTVKKGLKKGTYKVKVKVKAAGNKNYNAKTSTINFKVKVK